MPVILVGPVMSLYEGANTRMRVDSQLSMEASLGLDAVTGFEWNNKSVVNQSALLALVVWSLG